MFKKGNTKNNSTQQRPSLGRFAALVNSSIEDTDEDDFIPTTQNKLSQFNIQSKKRKLTTPSTTATTTSAYSIEQKRTKKTNLFQDVVSVNFKENRSSPPPPWLNLPIEIIQHIFSYIPIKPLITNIARVCRKWHIAIHDDKFLRWAKIHLRYEHEETTVLKMIDQMISHSDNVLQNILQRISAILVNNNPIDEQTIQFKFSSSTLTLLDKQLEKHPIYPFAIDLLSKNRMQQDFVLSNSNGKIYNPLCTTTAIYILSNSIESIRRLFHLWMIIDQIHYETTMDFFYFLLTLFTGATRLCNLQFRYPYRLYYCLKEYEDQILIPFNSISQHILNTDLSYTIYSSILSKLLLTPEQETIVCHNLENRQTMKINAYAGTGKTTTLIAYAAKRMDESFLYIAYNKAIQTYAEKVFPPNVKCQTIHSLAYAKIGCQFEGCLGNLRLKSIVDIVNERPVIGEKGRTINALYIRARFVYNALNNFIASADPQITDEHVENSKSSSSEANGQLVLTSQEKLNLAADARCIWAIMKDVRDTRVFMTHDGYLKLYQLSKPQIQMYDCLFVDEAQDLTPAVTDIINNQRVSKILVGDKHQQIYAFRGAVNAMTQIESTITYYLTKSFRFGFDIAFISNLILQKLCNEKKYLVGNNKSSSLDGQSASIDKVTKEQKAYLFRTNYNLFNCAVQLIIDKGLKHVGFVGGKAAMGFDKILDIFFLWLDPEERRKKNYQIKDPQLQSFSSFKTFEKFSQDVADAELLGKIKLVQYHGHSIIDKIKQLQEKCCSDLSQAEIILSTAHKAKGLEFPIVILSDDFLPRSSDSPLEQISLDDHRENLNILYVAATRATKELILNMDLFYLLYKMCREPFYDLSFSSNMEQCASCAIETDVASKEIKKEILLKVKPIQLSSNITTAGEYPPLPVCFKHLSESFISITQLYQSV